MVEQVLSYLNFSIILTLVSIQLTTGFRISEVALYKQKVAMLKDCLVLPHLQINVTTIEDLRVDLCNMSYLCL